MTRLTLQELGLKHLCERAWLHSYLPDYDEVLCHLRDRPIVLLEIGVGIGLRTRAPDGGPLPDGAGLRMWREYFSKGLILGADHRPCDLPNEDRIVILPPCDQASEQLADQVRVFAPGGVDVIIDDASHDPQKQRASYRLLRPLLRPNGFYFVEDIEHPRHAEEWVSEPGYSRHWARCQEGPGSSKCRADDVMVMLRG